MVVVCNNTNWIHAVPTTNLKAKTIAKHLLDLFLLFGFPKVVRGDAQFRSEILTAVRDLFNIQMRSSTAYHPQSHPTAERSNRTILEMLRKFSLENASCWDLKLPYLLAALREVPSETTGYSSYELVFGHKMRGLLSLRRQDLIGRPPEQDKLGLPAAQYVEQLGERIADALKAAGLNATKMHERNQVYFDRQATVRSLKPGDDVLVLRPTHDAKLLMRWAGPFKVLQKCEDNNYVIDMNGRQTLSHINALRRYWTEAPDGRDDLVITDQDQDVPNESLTTSEQAVIIPVIITERDDASEPPSDSDINDPTTTPSGNAGVADVKMGDQLSADQKRELAHVVKRYPDVFTDKLGLTHLARHNIIVTDEKPCWQASYSIPEALRGEVYDELTRMEKDGIIVADPEATWNSPMVLIRKSSGGLRIVNNYISLNRKSIQERYEMGRPLQLLNRVAGATFLSKLDLSRAYWQVELEPGCRRYTSFSTPFGVWKYIRMPQGLVNSSSTLMRIVDSVLRGAHTYADKLMDDIIVFGNDFDRHLTHIADVLDRLRGAGLTLNVGKCHLATDCITIFGFRVERGLIFPDPEKTKTVAEWPTPTTKKTVSKFHRISRVF